MLDGPLLERKIEKTMMLMITRLELPHQCLMIAQIYINRICASTAKTQMFLTSAILEK